MSTIATKKRTPVEGSVEDEGRWVITDVSWGDYERLAKLLPPSFRPGLRREEPGDHGRRSEARDVRLADDEVRRGSHGPPGDRLLPRGASDLAETRDRAGNRGRRLLSVGPRQVGGRQGGPLRRGGTMSPITRTRTWPSRWTSRDRRSTGPESTRRWAYLSFGDSTAERPSSSVLGPRPAIGRSGQRMARGERRSAPALGGRGGQLQRPRVVQADASLGQENVQEKEEAGMTMPLPFVIDNLAHRLVDTLNDLLGQAPANRSTSPPPTSRSVITGSSRTGFTSSGSFASSWAPTHNRGPTWD